MIRWVADSARHIFTPLAVKFFYFGLALLFAVTTMVVLYLGAPATRALNGVCAVGFVLTAAAVLIAIVEGLSPLKRKREFEESDLYSVLDRLVDDLDDEHAAYLQRRLDHRAIKVKNRVPENIQELLNQKLWQKDRLKR